MVLNHQYSPTSPVQNQFPIEWAVAQAGSLAPLSVPSTERNELQGTQSSATKALQRARAGYILGPMETAFYILLIAGHLGIFDVIYFHNYKCNLSARPECQREVFWHTISHAVYATQFIVIANFRFHGLALGILAIVYAADVIVAWSDVLEETASRPHQHGLARRDTFM